MELRQLRYFVRIFELSSISRAAEDLLIAQPALSQQLARLEAELGTSLLARNSRGVTPTETGVIFYKHAQLVLRQLQTLKSDVTKAEASPSGTVSIGMSPSVANILAAPLIMRCRTAYPNLRLKVLEGLTGFLGELVANARVEMAILFDRPPANSPRKPADTGHQYLKMEPLLYEELVFLSSISTDADPISVEEAAEHEYVLPAQSNFTRQMVDDEWKKTGLPLKVIGELDSTVSLKAIAAAGHGATILSEAALSQRYQEGLIPKRITGVDLVRRASLCTYANEAMGATAQKVYELTKRTVIDLVSEGAWRGAVLAPNISP